MIKDLPVLDKPREKAIAYGVEKLSDAELLAILIRTGTKSSSALDIAQRIVKDLGSLNSNITFELLKNVKGLGNSKAITILSALELGKRSLRSNSNIMKISSSKDVYEQYKYYFYDLKQEVLMVVFLDLNRKVIAHKKIYMGTINYLNLSHTEIFKEALLHSSLNIVLIHNHPSGSSFPSKEDIETTKKLKELGALLNINVIDHIIITNNNYYSLVDNGDL